MDPKILNFLYFNGFVVSLLVAYILYGRQKRIPTRLKLRESTQRDKGAPPSMARNDAAALTGSINKQAQSQQRQSGASSNQSPPYRERQLTVMFQFNGHDFEAHEVLGLAAGSSRETVEKIYREVLVKTSADSVEIYKRAYEAILKSTQ